MIKSKDRIKDLVVYQIYPRSFKDSNNDGIGDIKGIIEKLDYLEYLGINAIWLSPIYKSPMIDNGYDIEDYYAINDEFGTMEDFDNLLSEAKKRNIIIIMDLVLNHTSNKHQWFIEASKSKNNKYSDYYIFKDGKNNKEPNNRGSTFGGSAWTYVKERDQYYLHLFAKEQPDLNWSNVEVREEIYKMINFWIDKGVKGFRVDAISYLDKTKEMLDAPYPLNNEGYSPCKAFIAGNETTHNYIKELGNIFNSRNIFSVGECFIQSDEDFKKYVLTESNEFDMAIPFIPPVVEIKNISPNYLKNTFKHRYEILKDGGWWANFLSNHDKPRQISLYGNDSIESGKMLATLLHTLPGTPFVYQGEEIGMTNVYYDSIDEYNDLDTKNYYSYLLKSNKSKEEALKEIQLTSRDNARSPMQWDDSEFSGFSKVKPWLNVNPNYLKINVKSELNNPNSIFHYYKKLISLRKNNDILKYGDLEFIDSSDGTIVYLRKYKDIKWLVVLSFLDKEIDFKIDYKIKKVILENYPLKENKLGSYQALILEIE